MAKVLILDDEEDIGLALSDALEYNGYELPDVMTSAEKALEKIKSGNYALVLVDAKLSGRISGIEVIKACREFSKRPMIYAMSGIAKTSLTQILEDEGALDLVERVLEKPVDIQPQEFLRLLERAGVMKL